MKTFLNSTLEDLKDKNNYESIGNIYLINRKSKLKYWFYGLLIFSVVVAFLPWTQNIRAKGYVTTLRQEDRPQEITTVIPGRVVKWHVKEGDFVAEGDTILQLGEVKVEYFDPILLQRTRQQIEAKKQSIDAYEGKASTADLQIEALKSSRRLKLLSLDNKINQQRLKISSDSADLAAANNALLAYSRQIEAAQTMLVNGAISLTEFEKRRVNFQDGKAKVTTYSNKLNQNRQELLNLEIEKNGAVQEYADKIAKAEGDKFSSISASTSTEADVYKLENQLANYDARQQLYFVTAAQSGQITKARKAGIGEMIKEGEMIAEIVPQMSGKAVELFIEPMDLPLVSAGQKVRFVFDGFPAIIFSGWPNGSFGTFGGVVSAVETSVSQNGKFRILVAEDTSEDKWPERLRIGGGANGIALLKDVPIYYELWRNINGFPPEYYLAGTGISSSKEKKK